MLADLSRATMLELVPANELLTASAELLAPVLPESAGAGFLSGVGLPHDGGVFLMASTIVDDPGAFVQSSIAPEEALDIAEWQGRSLLLIGYTVVRDASIHVDRASGEVFASPGREDEEYELIHGDVSSLGCFLLAFHREIPDPLADRDTAGCVARIRAAVDAVDPIPFGSPDSLWNEFFDSHLY